MITLHYYPGNASLTPHFLLNEIGCDFELALVDRAANAHKSPEYRRLNPHGRIPTLVDGEIVIYETAAIALHLGDRFPESGLAPPVGSAARAHYYKWMAHLSSTVQAEMRPFFYPEQHVQIEANIEDVRRTAAGRLDAMFEVIDGLLGEGPYLLGDRFSAVDPYLFMLVRWGRLLPAPPRRLSNLARHAERLLARPAIARALAVEGLEEPYY